MPAERRVRLGRRAQRPAARSALRALVVLALLLTSPSSPADAARIEVPKPQGYVTDLAGVLDPATRTRLGNVIQELKQKTGAEIAVVTVRSTAPETAFDYAMAIAEQWKPGTKGKDNGIVFLVAVDDREMQILTGYGVEGALPDGKVGEIRDTLVVPAFRAGNYARGIADATTTMAALIAADAGVQLSGAPAPVRRSARRGTGSVGLGFILLLFVIIAILNSLGGGGPGGRRMRRRGGLGGLAGPLIFGSGGFGGGRRGGGFGGFGGGFGGGSGGFGGFGGGGFGGGGAGGKW